MKFRFGPGLANRLIACLYAVAALWFTSLSLAVYISDHFIGVPSFSGVSEACKYTFATTGEQRNQYTSCVERQRAFCEEDLADYAASSEQLLNAMARTNDATVTIATNTTRSCSDAIQTTGLALQAWQALGANQLIYYLSGNCTDAEQKSVASWIGDVSSDRKDAATVASNYSEVSQSTVSQLATYAQERVAYDHAYFLNKTSAMFEDLPGLVTTLNAGISTDLGTIFTALGSAADSMVACTTLRSQATLGTTACSSALESARNLYNTVRTTLDNQKTKLSSALATYETDFSNYKGKVAVAYDNMKSFYSGAQSLISVITLNHLADLSSYTSWSSMSLSDFKVTDISVPDATAIIASLTVPDDADAMWSAVSSSYTSFLAAITSSLASTEGVAAQLSQDLYEGVQSLPSVGLDDYNPPQYRGAATDHESNEKISGDVDKHATESDMFLTRSNELLNDMAAADSSADSSTANFSTATSFSVGGFGNISADTSYLTFAGPHSSTFSFDTILVSLGSIGMVAFVGDFIFRAFGTLRLIVRFLVKGALNIPDADIRVDKLASLLSSLSGFASSFLIFITRPATLGAIAAVLGLLILYVAASAYIPLYREYAGGCVTHKLNGTFLTENTYSVSFNYASNKGAKSRLSFDDQHNKDRSGVCTNMTQGVQETLSEQEVLLRYLLSQHETNVEWASLLDRCLDITQMDAMFLVACGSLPANTSSNSSSFGTPTGGSSAGEYRRLLSSSASASWQCPYDPSTSYTEPYDTPGNYLATASCSTSTLNASRWTVAADVPMNCDDIPTCTMTCDGPNAELLLASSRNCGCMAEWWMHSNWMRFAVTLAIFVLMNVSRVFVVGGVIRRNWRSMHGGVFAYRASCLKDGRVIVIKGAEEGETEPNGAERGRTRPQKDALLAWNRGVPTITNELREGLWTTIARYEASATCQILFGILLNGPWVAMLFFLSQDGLEYRPEP